MTTLLLVAVCSDATAEMLAGGAAEEIIAEGQVLFVSLTPNDSGYRLLTVHQGRVFECNVAVSETPGFEKLAVLCIGRPAQ